MKQSLPFAYSITHQKPGDHKSSTSVAISVVTTDIPGVRSGDVDVVAEWHASSNGRSQKNTVISWGEGLYRKLGISAETMASVKSTALARFTSEESLKQLYGIPHWGGIRGKQLLKALSGDGAARDIPKSRVITSTTLARDQAEAQHMVDGLIEVEGEIWHRVAGIVLRLFQIPGHEAVLSIAPTPYGQNKWELLHGMAGIQNPLSTQYFDINELNRALTHIDGDERVQWFFKNLTIHHPELISYDGQSEFTAQIMNSAVRTNEYRAGDMNDREISLWMRMREAVNNWYSIPSVPLEEEDVEALYEFCALTPKPHMNEWPRRGCEIINIYRSSLEGPPPTKAPSVRR
jgi:hypothetical protein